MIFSANEEEASETTVSHAGVACRWLGLIGIGAVDADAVPSLLSLSGACAMRFWRRRAADELSRLGPPPQGACRLGVLARAPERQHCAHARHAPRPAAATHGGGAR